METEKLFEQDAYLRTFRATVRACEPSGKRWRVVLDRTAFYPEGGGQPGDQGVLDRVRVLDTRSKDGVIYHEVDAPLPVGAKVSGGIHWGLRRQHMQEHTGEHILSGLLHRFYGVQNVGFHMGAACTTLDLDKPLDAHAVALGERLANEAIFRDLPVQVCYPDAKALAQLAYRSKKELQGQVRIVTVPGYDVCACCGTHVARTGEIGLLKVVDAMHYKGGVRLSILCGERALRDYGEKHARLGRIGALLSAKPEACVPAVERLQGERSALQQQLAAAQDRLFATLAAALAPAANGWICRFEPDLAPDALRRFALLLAEKCPAGAAVFSAGQDRCAYALAAKQGDLRPLGKQMHAALQGRGGGKPGLLQGSVQADREAIAAFFAQL